MPAPLIPVVVAVGVAVAYRAVGQREQRRASLSAERLDCFRGAMRALQDPTKLRALADTFEREGHPTEAQLLRNRAKLREWPPEVKKARRAAFRKFMRSTDAAGVERGAEAFSKIGAHGAAEELREYARALRTVEPARVEELAAAYEGRNYSETAEALRRKAAEEFAKTAPAAPASPAAGEGGDPLDGPPPDEEPPTAEEILSDDEDGYTPDEESEALDAQLQEVGIE